MAKRFPNTLYIAFFIFKHTSIYVNKIFKIELHQLFSVYCFNNKKVYFWLLPVLLASVISACIRLSDLGGQNSHDIHKQNKVELQGNHNVNFKLLSAASMLTW